MVGGKEEEEEEKASWRRLEGTVCLLLQCREAGRQASEEESMTRCLLAVASSVGSGR